MQNLPLGETFEVDAVDPEGVSTKLTETTSLALDRNGTYIATLSVKTADGSYLSIDPVDGWHIGESGQRYRMLVDLPGARQVE